jgi:16S rRNA (guanine527-N7)-methyltransferase
MVDRVSAPDAERQRDVVRSTLLAGGLAPGDAARISEPLVAYATLLDTWGSRLNLTGLHGVDAILARLVVDATLVGRALPDFASLVDIGSGAGLPGIPMALLFPERQFLLIEPRERRHHFLRHAVRELRVENIRTLRARADEPVPERHDVAIAQAVGPPETVAPMLIRWVRPGGWIAIPTVATGTAVPPPSSGLDWRLEAYGVESAAHHALWLARVPESPTP